MNKLAVFSGQCLLFKIMIQLYNFPAPFWILHIIHGLLYFNIIYTCKHTHKDFYKQELERPSLGTVQSGHWTFQPGKLREIHMYYLKYKVYTILLYLPKKNRPKHQHYLSTCVEIYYEVLSSSLTKKQE